MAPAFALGHRSPPSISPFARAILVNRDVNSTSAYRSSKMSVNGDFNGTCSKSDAASISPETPPGSCASYFSDVTDYCCAAVGGYYNANFYVTNTTQVLQAALDHPICQTSNYADMFSCFQFVTEAHCPGVTPAPYGVCNKDGPDTSKQKSSASSLNPSSHAKFKWIIMASIVSILIPTLAV